MYVQGEEVDITRHTRDEEGCHSHIYLVKMVQIPAMVDWKIMQLPNIQIHKYLCCETQKYSN